MSNEPSERQSSCGALKIVAVTPPKIDNPENLCLATHGKIPAPLDQGPEPRLRTALACRSYCHINYQDKQGGIGETYQGVSVGLSKVIFPLRTLSVCPSGIYPNFSP